MAISGKQAHKHAIKRSNAAEHDGSGSMGLVGRQGGEAGFAAVGHNFAVDRRCDAQLAGCEGVEARVEPLWWRKR